MNKYLVLMALMLVSCSTQKTRLSVDWKKDSDKITKSYTNSLARLDPEEYSIMGLAKFDSSVTSYSKNYDQERYSHAYKWEQKLLRFLEIEKNPELRADINILIEDTRIKMAKYELAKKAGVVPFLPLTQSIYGTLKYFFIPELPQAKKNSALLRFRKYVRGDEKSLPLMDGYTSYMLSRMNYLAENKKRGFWPTDREIKNYLENSDQYLEGIENLLKTSKTEDWKRDFEELKLQDENFRKFLVKKVLPYARRNTQIPIPVYTYMLKTNGIDATPQELISTATEDYKNTYQKFKAQAAVVARKYELASKDPASVVAYLRSWQIKDDEELLKTYKRIADDIFKLLNEKDILTVKTKPEYILRFASKLESHGVPNPQFIGTPVFTKTKIPAQFIIPRVEDIKGMNDYNFVESAYMLTAHEAIPGHALQAYTDLKNGTTIARGYYASNNVNIEGWGLYSEDIIYPYTEDEVKLILLQRRLWRQARMFLDPQLNLGLIKPDRVISLYTKELGFSEGLAQSELRRYSYISPAQAPSYYYGLKIILDAKAKTKARPNMIFHEKCFNDALLNAGILPLKEISDRLVKNLNCESL